ncbi:MAG: hypothetical protein ABI614_24345 [Planctomycetota bacterium]
MDPTEVYVLCESRSADLAERFLNACLPERTPGADDFPFPEFVDEPSDTFDTPEELMRRLEKDKNASYSIYWNATSNDGPRQAMLFYTEDGAMIAGIGGPNSGLDETLACVAKQVNGRFGYITSGSCPPETIEAFIGICRESTLVNVFEGHLRNPSRA